MRKIYRNWVISREAPNRRTFNDQWVMSVTHVESQAIGDLKKVNYFDYFPRIYAWFFDVHFYKNAIGI